MVKFTLKRILQAIPLVVLISIITFSLIQMAPYDAIDVITTPDMSPELVETLKKEHGLDKPVHIQYIIWAKNVLKGNFGYSIVTRTSISDALSTRIPATMILVVPAYIISLIIAIILGLLSGSKRGGVIDRIVEAFCSLAISAPSFWIGMLLIYVFSYHLKIFPSTGMYTIGQEETFSDLLMHLVLPCTTLSIAFLPQMIRYVRSSTIGQLSEDYVTVQKSYGATKFEILSRHIFKNILLPLVTLFGMYLPMLVTGAFITESIFSWPGVGPYFLTAISGFDYPIIMTVLILSSSLVILGNLIADILYCLIDTRIKDVK